MSVVAATISVATCCVASIPQQVPVMPESWFRLEVGEHGKPDYTSSPKHSRVQREALRKLCWLKEESELCDV